MTATRSRNCVVVFGVSERNLQVSGRSLFASVSFVCKAVRQSGNMCIGDLTDSIHEVV